MVHFLMVVYHQNGINIKMLKLITDSDNKKHIIDIAEILHVGEFGSPEQIKISFKTDRPNIFLMITMESFYKQIEGFYLVTGSLDGEGAYYHAIFSSKEKADTYIKESGSGHYDYHVEQLFLDEPE